MLRIFYKIFICLSSISYAIEVMGQETQPLLGRARETRLDIQAPHSVIIDINEQPEETKKSAEEAETEPKALPARYTAVPLALLPPFLAANYVAPGSTGVTLAFHSYGSTIKPLLHGIKISPATKMACAFLAGASFIALDQCIKSYYGIDVQLDTLGHVAFITSLKGAIKAYLPKVKHEKKKTDTSSDSSPEAKSQSREKV